MLRSGSLESLERGAPSKPWPSLSKASQSKGALRTSTFSSWLIQAPKSEHFSEIGASICVHPTTSGAPELPKQRAFFQEDPTQSTPSDSSNLGISDLVEAGVLQSLLMEMSTDEPFHPFSNQPPHPFDTNESE